MTSVEERVRAVEVTTDRKRTRWSGRDARKSKTDEITKLFRSYCGVKGYGDAAENRV